MIKKMQNNLHYFKVSQENPEPHLDESYFLIEKHADLAKYVKDIKEIKEILIAIKKMREVKEKPIIQEKYFQKLFIAFNKKTSNCSELGCFVNACDTTRDLIQKDYDSFKKVTISFLKCRDTTERVPENWVQAILDSNSSRRKGDLGEAKLIKILKQFGYCSVLEWMEFTKKDRCVLRCSSDNKKFSILNVRNNLNLKIPTKKQDKRLDLIIKDKENIFLLEAKHSNVSGGEQDKQVSELIEIISLPKERSGIFFVSFLDGTRSNQLLGKISRRAEKMLKQRQEIEEYLNKNNQNFWLNTAGFKDLFKDVTQ